MNGRHELGAMDLCVLRHSQGGRDIGCGGLAIQTQLWLQGRLDPAVLRTALARLSQSHPVVTARLVEERRKGRAHWRFRPGAECVLHETTVKDPGETAALDRAADILQSAADPAEADPISFHLLHLPEGRDLLLVQHDHCLMDIHGTKALIREIDRLSQGLTPTPEADGDAEDGTRTHLRRFTFWQRFKAVWRFGDHSRLIRRSTPVSLSDAVDPIRGGKMRIAIRELDEERTAAFLARTTRLCGFPSPSMTILASIFRGILRHTPHPLTNKSALLSSTGTNLRSRGAVAPIFRNLGSLLSYVARPEDMGELDKLILLLNRQVREQTRRGTDLAVLQWVWWLRHCPGFWRGHVRKAMHHHGVNYGYLGQLVADGDRFCGTPLDRQVVTTSVWSPPALAVAPSICRGRLILPAAYMADTIPEARLRAFLDTVVADLVN
jgi:hypothetical protein